MTEARPAAADSADDAADPSPPRRLADALCALSLDAVAEAGSGDAALALRMAEPAAALWTRFLKFDAADPGWPDRDRFILSAGHGAILLHALLHLTGHAGMTMDDLRRFRRLHSPASGHPQPDAHPAVEACTGPPGQGLANGVGMALAERLMSARFGRSLVDHRTWVLCGHDDLTDGLCQEAATMAGQLRLDKFTVLFDASVEAPDELLRRFAGLGWATRQVYADDGARLAGALAVTLRSQRPTLIACCPATELSVDDWRQATHWRHDKFSLPDELARGWRAAGERGATTRRAWLKRLSRHPLRADFERLAAGRLPDSLHERIALLKTQLAETRPEQSTEHASLLTLEALAPHVPELLGGSAGATSCAQIGPAVTVENFAGRHLDWGARSHAMAAAMNGMALHGGIIPFGGAVLLASDSMRPALRLAALSRLRVIHVAAQDSIALGADGAAHQPVEQLAGLRGMPNLFVFRPADALETVECWDLALRRTGGPSVLALSGRVSPLLRGDTMENGCARGGYLLARAEPARLSVTLIASGAEVGLAMAVRSLLAPQGISAAVVSLPCWELFAGQDASYRAAVLRDAPRFGIEAAGGFGWERWLGPDGVFIGLAGFGASAPAGDLYRHFALTPDAIAERVCRTLA